MKNIFIDTNKTFLEKGKLAGAKFSVMIFIYLFVSVIIEFIISPLSGGNIYYAINALCAPIAILLTLFIFKKEDKSFTAKLKLKKTQAKNYLLAILLFLGVFLAFGHVNQAVASLLNSWGLKTSSIQISDMNFGEYLLFVFTLAIIPAIFEELFFRGSFFDDVYGQNKWLSYIVVALFFSIYHCSLAQFFYQFIYGFLLAVLADKSQSIFPAVLAHLLNNFVILTFEFIKIDIDAFTNNVLVMILGILLIGVFFFFTVKGEKKNGAIEQTEKNGLSGLVIPFGFIGIAVCLTIIISGLFL